MTGNSRPLALITGASSGLGADFAHLLAARGYDLLISARRAERLETLKQELTRQYACQVDTLPCDLASPQGAQSLANQAIGLGRPIAMLVNNAGLGYHEPFASQPWDHVSAMLQINLQVLTELTHAFLPSMLQHRAGYVLNVASFTSFQAIPNYAIYSATKAYVLSFSQTLHHESKPHGVHVSALCPGFFESEFFGQAGFQPNWIVRRMMLNRQQVALQGIQGVLRGRPVIVPGFSYRMIERILRFLPRRWKMQLAELTSA